ncbi:MAG: N-acetyltransferase [Firmicutes bacterium]|nr:N-acetyltransferase [Bacillota bacterium]
MQIRLAEKRDLADLLEIYNDEVEHGVATFDLNPKSMGEWETWFAAHNIENHPLIVAECGGKAVGYASLSSYREKEAYRTTVELSLYVHKDYRRKGIATALMTSILDMARKDDSIHTVVSVITAENDTSIALHEKFGFAPCGVIHDVGIKFGRYLSIANFELRV